MRNFFKRIAYPLLKPIYFFSSKRKKTFSKHGISLTIYPSVFHPGLFISTQLLVDYLSSFELTNKKILELGAGSGFISFYLTKHKGAILTASDINKFAIEGLEYNKFKTGLAIEVIQSDLFQNIPETTFDYIVINPPYYPKKALDNREIAFYCGEQFEYFQTLFSQLNSRKNWLKDVIMILSEDCDLEKIKSICAAESFSMELLHEQKKMGEKNFIFCIESRTTNK